MDNGTLFALFIIVVIIWYIWQRFGRYIGLAVIGLIVFLILSEQFGFHHMISALFYLIVTIVIGSIIFVVWVGYQDHVEAKQQKLAAIQKAREQKVYAQQQAKARKAYFENQVHKIIKAHGFETDNQQMIDFPEQKPITKTVKLTTGKYWEVIKKQLETMNQSFHTNTKDGDSDLVVAFELLGSFKRIPKYLSIINNSSDISIPVPEVSPITTQVLNGFQEVINQFKKTRTGKLGEKRVLDAVAYQRGTTKILCNYNVRFDYGKHDHSERDSNQMDMILINQQGIFILEIKNINAKYFILSDSGRIRSGNAMDKLYTAKEIVTAQMEKHRAALKAALPKSIDLEPVSLLIAANEKAIINSDVPNINVYKPNTFYSAEIAQRPHVLTEEQVEQVYQTLLEAQVGEQTFLFPIFEDDFVKKLLRMNGYMWITKKLANLAANGYQENSSE